MCVMSVVLDYGQKHQDTFWTPANWPPYVKLIEEAKKVDELLNEPDCEDPEKVIWFERIEKRVAELEAKETERNRDKGPQPSKEEKGNPQNGHTIEPTFEDLYTIGKRIYEAGQKYLKSLSD